MEEMRVGRYYHPESQTEWQIVEWGKDSDHMKNVDEFRLTRNGIEDSQLTTFAIAYPNGKVKHLTFAGYLPEDYDEIYEYWVEGGSL